jgi:hypothetical protein
MRENKNNSPVKRPYQKPQIENVNLVPEEAVLTPCKVAGLINSFIGNNCWVSGVINCSTAGS